VDEQGHVARRVGGRDDGLVVEQVEPQRHHAGVVDVEALGAASRRVDLARSTLEQLEHELAADAAVGSGDEGGLTGDVHGFLSFLDEWWRVRPGLIGPASATLRVHVDVKGKY